jgi:hypothetical protein
MVQTGQVFMLESTGPGGERLWAYRYRTGGVTPSACNVAASFVTTMHATGSHASSRRCGVGRE